MTAIVVTATGTDIGKTVFAAALTAALDGYYWKPVQAGLDDGTDRERVLALSGLSDDRILPEAYRLTTPCSPHRAAEIDGVMIDVEALAPPLPRAPATAGTQGSSALPRPGFLLSQEHENERFSVPYESDGQHTLVIEGAGGVLVPFTRSATFADLVARWHLPAVLVAATSLGTISHSLAAIEALRSRGVEICGVAFVGDANEDSEATIADMGKVKRLGRLPLLDPLTPATLAAAFAANFDLADFR